MFRSLLRMDSGMLSRDLRTPLFRQESSEVRLDDRGHPADGSHLMESGRIKPSRVNIRLERLERNVRTQGPAKPEAVADRLLR
jgi:hypothetical protein